MQEHELKGILDFLKSAEQLKNTLRNSRTTTGRQESTAEHTWRLCLMVMVFEKEYPNLDTLKLMKMIVVHDLGEVIHGDIPAIDQINNGKDKSIEERKDFQQLLQPLPGHLQEEFIALWDEYEQASTPEAIMAKAMDKIETILQHAQGHNPPDFDYQFNLTYGKKFTDRDNLMSRLRQLIDEETRQLSDRR